MFAEKITSLHQNNEYKVRKSVDTKLVITYSTAFTIMIIMSIMRAVSICALQTMYMISHDCSDLHTSISTTLTMENAAFTITVFTAVWCEMVQGRQYEPYKPLINKFVLILQLAFSVLWLVNIARIIYSLFDSEPGCAPNYLRGCNVGVCLTNTLSMLLLAAIFAKMADPLFLFKPTVAFHQRI